MKITNICPGSRIQIYNPRLKRELFNDIVDSGTLDIKIRKNSQVRLRAACPEKLFYEVILPKGIDTLLMVQKDDGRYHADLQLSHEELIKVQLLELIN